MQPLDLKNKKFGRLTPVEVVFIDKKRKWICKCDCGNEVVALAGSLTSGNSKSCGCFHRENLSKRNFKHGGAKTPTYYIWAALKDRCLNKNNKSWKRYGGRGIKVCDKWMEFKGFYEDMGEKPGKEFSIDRKDNDGDYEKSNCRWVTKLTQSNNTSTNKFVIAFGEKKTIAEWTRDKRCEVSSQTLGKRLKRGIKPENAMISFRQQ